MKTIKSALFAVIALFAFTSASSASPLTGVYAELGTSAVGVSLDGTVTEADNTIPEITTGQIGKTAITVSYGLGYMTNRARTFGLDVGYMWNPGEAKIKSDTSDKNGNVTFEVSDSTDYYLSPMINLSEDASIYFKYGKTKSDVNVVGDVTKINNMDGETLALGSIMSWGTKMYIRAEAGTTEYDRINVTGLGGTGGVPTDTTVTASPSVHFGKVAVGFKF
jgi:hypothetical protein